MYYFYLFNSTELWVQIATISTLALLCGSFVSLASHRTKTREPIIFGRSRCIHCGVTLKPHNLIPLFSWILQGGACANCKSKISIRYPLIELTFLITFLITFFAFNKEMNFIVILHLLIAGVLIFMSVVDIEEFYIPNIAQYLLTIFVTLIIILQNQNLYLTYFDIFDNIKAGLLYLGFSLGLFVFFYFTAHVEALGVDDMKFFFIAGLALNIDNFLPFMMLSGIFGIIFGLTWKKIKKNDIFPFGPPICLSLFVCLLFSEYVHPTTILNNLIAI